MAFKNKPVSLTIRDNVTGAYLVVPVLPDRIEYQEGEKQANTVSILNLGDVDFLGGVALDTMAWSSEFPSRYDLSYVQTRDLKTPTQYRDQFRAWKDNGTPLQLVCPAAGINQRVYMQSFTWDLRGAEGDIYYSVGFKELKNVKPRKISSSLPTPPKPKVVRPAKPKQTKAKPPAARYHVVQKGEYLIKIAKKHRLKNWRSQLYNPNKKPKGPLGSNPNLIYPGQKLKLP